ncbi:reverse transcriptase domain-containing protein [Tanacetum coccineum]
MALTRRSNANNKNNNNNRNPKIAAIIVQQLQNIIPQIVTQVTNNVNNANANTNANGNGNRNGNGGNNGGCTYKEFLACKTRDFDGKGRAIALTLPMGMTWDEFKALLVEEFYPSNDMKKLETEFWNHAMIRSNHATYTDRFHELAKLVPHFVTLESKGIKRYIHGLVPQIYGMIQATQPTMI